MGPWEWMKRHRKPILAISLAIGIIIACLYLWLLYFFNFGDDLIIDFSANQTSFRIKNDEQAPVMVSLTTSNQLMCRAQCRFIVEDVSAERTITDEVFIHKSNEVTKREFRLSPKPKGAGQVIYSVTASCHNNHAPLCPTTSPERQKSILLTVNYGLTNNEMTITPMLRSRLEQMLLLLRDTDLAILEAKSIAATPELKSAGLTARMAAIEEEYYTATLAMETFKLVWQDEAYAALDNMLKNSTTTPESLNATLAGARSLASDARGLGALHNELRDKILDARAETARLIGAGSWLTPEINVAEAMDDAADDADALTSLYGSGAYPDYANLVDNIGQLREENIALNTTIYNASSSVIMMGNLKLAETYTGFCALNITCVSAPAVIDIGALCSAINMTAGIGPLTNETVVFNNTYCGLLPATPWMNMSALLPITLVIPNVTSDVDVVLPENLPQCCVFGECRECCNTARCQSDPMTFPVVFVHGHAFNAGNSPEYSLGGYFSKIQRSLARDGYLDAGIVTPSSTFSEVAPGEWGLSGKPITARVTYYYNFYKSGTDYILVTQKSENIETYAIRLKEMIDIVRHHTGKEKVDIVAHSMGGLVVRRYLQLFGEEGVNTVVLIGTPNNGITDSTERLCPLFGATKECDDMEEDSVFMTKLNDPGSQPTKVRFVTIAASGCPIAGKPGDGVVTVESVALPYATNYVVNGTCDDLFGSDLHTEMLNSDKHPDVYEIVQAALAKD